MQVSIGRIVNESNVCDLLAASISSSLINSGPRSLPLTPIRSLSGPKMGSPFSSSQTSLNGLRYCNSRL